MYSDGSYEYRANNAKELNPGQTARDYFTYTAFDGDSSVEAKFILILLVKRST